MRPAITGALVLVLLTGCVSAQTPDGTDAPVGPQPPTSGSLTLESVDGIVTDNDLPATTIYSPDGTISNAAADLASEQDYWISVGGRPDACAGVVSAPYLVSASDTGDRLDDRSALLGTATEIDEDRFGLIQVYARQFDDAATASGFLTELTQTVAGCSSYQLVDGDTVTWNAVALQVAPLTDLPADVSGLRYVETLRDSSALAVTTTFLQRDGIVVSIYCETTTTSTMTQDDAAAVADAVAERLGLL